MKIEQGELFDIIGRVKIMHDGKGFSKILVDDFDKIIAEIFRLQKELDNV